MLQVQNKAFKAKLRLQYKVHHSESIYIQIFEAELNRTKAFEQVSVLQSNELRRHLLTTIEKFIPRKRYEKKKLMTNEIICLIIERERSDKLGEWSWIKEGKQK